MKRKLIFLTLGTFFLGLSQAFASPPDDKCNGGTPCKTTPVIKKYVMTGQVLKTEKKLPIKDVTITAYAASKKEKVVFSDQAGAYSFAELKPGIYRFVFEKSGYRKIVRDNVIIKLDEILQMNIEMTEIKHFDLMPSPMHFTDF